MIERFRAKSEMILEGMERRKSRHRLELRNQEITKRVLSGETVKDVAKDYDLGGERVRQIIERMALDAAYPEVKAGKVDLPPLIPGEFPNNLELNVRSDRCIREMLSAGVFADERELVRLLFEHPEKLLRWPGFGKTSLNEVKAAYQPSS